MPSRQSAGTLPVTTRPLRNSVWRAQVIGAYCTLQHLWGDVILACSTTILEFVHGGTSWSSDGSMLTNWSSGAFAARSESCWQGVAGGKFRAAS